jgi:glycosyltransferase involved in cell wall biosynthesis
MRIFLVGYQTLMMNRGGPTYKILKMKEHLGKHGVDAQLYNMWEQDYNLGEGDIFHIFNASISTYDVAKNLKSKGLPYVVNPIFYSNRSAKEIKIYRKVSGLLKKAFVRSHNDYDLTKSVCDGAEYVLPNTDAEGDLLHHGLEVSRENMITMHNGVERRFYDADPSLFIDKYGLKDFILYVGHIGPERKNVLRILKAAEQIDHPFVLIADIMKDGEGPQCKEIIERNKHIHYLGWMRHDDPMLESAYAAADTFVLSSTFETPGRAALEAALAKTKIIITPNGGTKEYFKKMALYPDPLAVNEIKLSIEKSLNKKFPDELRQFVYDNFIWEKIAHKHIELYRNINE